MNRYVSRGEGAGKIKCERLFCCGKVELLSKWLSLRVHRLPRWECSVANVELERRDGSFL